MKLFSASPSARELWGNGVQAAVGVLALRRFHMLAALAFVVPGSLVADLCARSRGNACDSQRTPLSLNTPHPLPPPSLPVFSFLTSLLFCMSFLDTPTPSSPHFPPSTNDVVPALSENQPRVTPDPSQTLLAPEGASLLQFLP